MLGQQSACVLRTDKLHLEDDRKQKDRGDKAIDIADALRRAIFEHRIFPGTKLSEDEVGDLFGVSRTIVRAALHSLAHSELVTIEKNRGAFVAKPSTLEAREVFEARALIEPKVARMAAERITKEHLTRLRSHLDAEHAAKGSGDKGYALSLSGDFHLEIAAIAAHEVYSQFVRTLVSRSSLIIALYWKRPDTTCESHSHHALLEAFESQDALAAEEVMLSHIIDLRSGLDLSDRPDQVLSLADAIRR